MRNALTIFRREFTAYFTGPVGYVFLAAFILFTNLLGLFIVQPWFDYPEPGLRGYFYVLLGVSAFFVAAVTMRLWADERRGNTYEMLLTLPMRARDLVLGKFLAGLGFYAIALALTATVPFMAARVTQAAAGSPGAATAGFFGALDAGAILAAYLGAFLAGAVFLAFGLFVSGLCQDQIVAFVLTAPALFLAYLLGLPPIQAMLDSAFDFAGPGAGRALGRTVGVFDHYENLVRGLVDVGDVLFFLVWTALFLFLNTLTLERRGRKGANFALAAAIALVFAIGGVANAGLLADLRLGRADVTRDGLFTVHPVTRRVLAGLDTPVMLQYHVTPRDQLPPELQATERDVIDKLDALKDAAGGKLDYTVVRRHADGADVPDGDGDENGELADKALRRVEPFIVSVAGADKATDQIVYSGLAVAYGDKKAEVLIPRLVSGASASGVGQADDVAYLEYAVVDYVHRAARPRTPVVALVAPRGRPFPPQLVQMFLQQGRPPPPPDDPFNYAELILARWEGLDVRRVALTAEEPMPADADLLVVLAPEALNARQVHEIRRALASGVPTLLAVQRQRMEYRLEAVGRRASIVRSLTTFAPDVAPLMPPGAAVDARMLMEPPDRCFTHLRGAVGGAAAWLPYGPWPMHALLTQDNFDPQDKFFENVRTLRWPWGATLDLDAEALAAAGFTVRTLAQSGPDAWRRMMTGSVVTDADMAPPGAEAAGEDAARAPFPLMALIEGQFPFDDAERPDWPPAEANPYDPAPPTPAEAPFAAPELKPGKLLLLADAMLFHRDGLDRGLSELTFLANAAAQLVMTGPEREIRDLRQATFAPPAVGRLTPAQQRWWKTVQIGGHLAAVTLVGCAVWLWRARRREAYRRAARREA